MREAVVLLILVLAGCSEAPEPVADDPCVVESADDLSCAEADLDKRPDEVEHVHNYWGGQDKVTLLEETQDFGDSVLASCEPIAVRVFYPPDEATVYQGTGRVDISPSVDLAPDHRAGTLEIWVKRADQDSPEYVGDLDGETITLEVGPEAADLPHQKLSAWEFWVYANPEPTIEPVYCMVQPRGTVSMTVDIHQTLELEPFPGHPDHWQNETELPLMDAYASLAWTEDVIGSCLTGSGEASHPEGSCQMWGRGFGPQDLIVPPGASKVRLTLTADPGDGHDQAVLGLAYHGADTREFEAVEPESRSGNVAEYEIDVDYRDDGPYATQSQWRFKVVLESDPAVYRGGWSLEGSVLRHTG